ncbi:TPA: MFS transporter permease [Streptococcus suis]|uniref:MFS transporter permease n=1 Tax=Streptococcus suis TaxID=1307 RepID=A0A426TCC2_STRSU|nr:MFS transporter permease [Streptococcus suis]HEM4699787.1 MFS transporter permease [Streptococcus suis]HEM4716016.1 MFS transporter permease [Streptococcus suis]HEM4720701.1 MFS transporter permease [Streptococcus suis]HEM4727244.1 MFS transporter permease [Streptococcus suis]
MNVFLKNKLYRVITISDCLSVIGDSIFYLALIAYASKIDNSILAVSIVSVSEAIPPFFSVYTGYLVDRTNNKAMADILTNILRFIIYLLIAVILYFYNGIIAIGIISVLNILSDLMGSYSDNLRFPIIYSIIPDEDMEESFSFSNITYYTFSFGAKVFGGTVLLLLGSDFITFSLLNSITFLVAGLMMLHIFSDLKLKIANYEDNTIDNNEVIDNTEDETIFKSLLNLMNNKKLVRVVFPVAFVNSLVACLLPLMYIYMNNPLIVTHLPYETIISLLGAISVIGIIIGNWVATRYFKSFSLYKILIFLLITLGFISILLIFEANLYFLLVTVFLVFGLEGILSPKFSLYLMENQNYESLGISSGAINTLLAIGVPVKIFLVLTTANILGLLYSELLLILFIGIYIFLVMELGKKYAD